MDQITAAITQMEAMLNQANGMPVPSAVQLLRGEIPHQEVPPQSNTSARGGRSRAPSVSHRTVNTRNTNRGSENNGNGNERSHNVIINSQNHSHQENHRHDLRGDLNSRLQGRDLRDSLNERRAEQSRSMDNDPFHLRQRWARVQNDPLYQQVADL